MYPKLSSTVSNFYAFKGLGVCIFYVVHKSEKKPKKVGVLLIRSRPMMTDERSHERQCAANENAPGAFHHGTLFSSPPIKINFVGNDFLTLTLAGQQS